MDEGERLYPPTSYTTLHSDWIHTHLTSDYSHWQSEFSQVSNSSTATTVHCSRDADDNGSSNGIGDDLQVKELQQLAYGVESDTCAHESHQSVHFQPDQNDQSVPRTGQHLFYSPTTINYSQSTRDDAFNTPSTPEMTYYNLHPYMDRNINSSPMWVSQSSPQSMVSPVLITAPSFEREKDTPRLFDDTPVSPCFSYPHSKDESPEIYDPSLVATNPSFCISHEPINPYESQKNTNYTQNYTLFPASECNRRADSCIKKHRRKLKNDVSTPYTTRRRKSLPSGAEADSPTGATTRSKSGCWTCRIRRKKCPEEKPSCSSCLRLGLVCDGYSPVKPDFMRGGQKAQEKLNEIKAITMSKRADDHCT